MPAADPHTQPRPARVLVYGVTGSGKSAAAARIADRLRVKCHLADELAWEVGWKPVDPGVQRDRFAGIAAAESWVLDTAYSAWADVVLPRAALIVALDYPRWFSLQRLVRRTVRRVMTKEPVCNGNVETLGTSLSSDSILRWHFQSFSRKRAFMRKMHAATEGPQVLLIRRPGDLERWINRLAPAATSAGIGE